MHWKTESYDLLREDWIPILWCNGRFSRAGIREVLTKAHRIKQIAAPNPMDRVAIIRFLLALLYWSKGNPPNDAHGVVGESFPESWFQRLEDADTFRLLGHGQRFYQDPSAQRCRPITDLLQEIPTGNNFWHFRHATDYTDGLCPRCIALGLLRLPLFAVSGLPNLMAGINGAPPIYAVPCGASLYDTLVSNWLPRMPLGEPTWAGTQTAPNPHDDVPLLEGLTLRSRKVWLHEPCGATRPCVGCGKNDVLIYKCGFETAGKQENDRWHDPHVFYLSTSPRQALRAADLTKATAFRMDRPWRDLFKAILDTGRHVSTGKATSLLVVGLATDKAKYIDVWERTIQLRPRSSEEETVCLGVSSLTESPPTMSSKETAITRLTQWQHQVKTLEEIVGRRKGSILGKFAASSIQPHIEDGLSSKSGEVLNGSSKVWQDAEHQYQFLMKIMARALYPAFTTVALSRQEELISKISIYQKNRAKHDKTTERKRDANDTD